MYSFYEHIWMYISTFGGQRDIHDASTNFGADALLSLLASSSVKNLKINLIFRRRKNHICYYKMISTTRVYYSYFS